MMISRFKYLVQAKYPSLACQTESSIPSEPQRAEGVRATPPSDTVKCNVRWDRNLRQCVDHTDPLFNVFESKEALRWVLFVRNIDARGWKLHMRDPESTGIQHKYLSYVGSFFQSTKLEICIL